MATCVYDPPPTDEQYARMNLTRPLTGAAIGNPRRRGRDARISARMKGYERPRRDRKVVVSPWTGRKYVLVDGAPVEDVAPV